jgi:hypothetical protein
LLTPRRTDDRRLYFFFFVFGAAFLVAFFIGKTPFVTSSRRNRWRG